MKRKHYILAGIAAAIWLFLWASETGVLVASRRVPENNPSRICHYLIGFSIIEKASQRYDRAGRCPLFADLKASAPRVLPGSRGFLFAGARQARALSSPPEAMSSQTLGRW